MISVIVKNSVCNGQKAFELAAHASLEYSLVSEALDAQNHPKAAESRKMSKKESDELICHGLLPIGARIH